MQERLQEAYCRFEKKNLLFVQSFSLIPKIMYYFKILFSLLLLHFNFILILNI
jgi:hypothetical protein